MRILVLGAGMYVTGRGNRGHGPVLASIHEHARTHETHEVCVVSRSSSNDSVVAEASARLSSLLGASIPVTHTVIPDTGSLANHLRSTRRYDAAIVCLPDHLHFPYAKILLENGLHTLMVKPFVLTTSEADILEELRKRADVHGAVEFHKRFDEANLLARQIIAEKKLGSLLYASVDYSQKVTIPLEAFGEWTAHTNIFNYLGVHYVDLLHFLTGFMPRRVMATGLSKKLVSRGLQTPDSVHASVIWEDPSAPGESFYSHFNINWIDPTCSSAVSDQKFIVVGTEGRLHADQKNRGLQCVSEQGGIEDINPYFSQLFPSANGGLEYGGYGPRSIFRFLDDVTDIIRGQATPAGLVCNRPSFQSARVSTSVLEAATKSLSSNSTWVVPS